MAFTPDQIEAINGLIRNRVDASVSELGTRIDAELRTVKEQLATGVGTLLQ